MTVFALLLCVRCAMKVAGGGTDVANPVVMGSVVFVNGQAGSQTKVQLIPADYNPASGVVLPDSLTDTTDANGIYHIKAPAKGLYSVQAVQVTRGTRCLITGINVQQDTTRVECGILKIPGTVRIMLSDSIGGTVYVSGTTFKAVVLPGISSVELDSIPDGVLPQLCYIVKNTSQSSILRDNVVVTSGLTTWVTNPAWKYSRRIVLNTSPSGGDVAGTVTKFPVLVRLTKSNFDFSQAASHGRDILFTKADNTPLSCQIERWDSAAGVAEVWVSVDTVYGNNDTQYVTLLWGNPAAASRSDSTAVFGSAYGYSGVWHLDETSGTLALDATGNGHSGTFKNTLPQSAIGSIATCQQLNGKGDYVDLGNTLDAGTQNVFASAWIKRKLCDSVVTIISKSTGWTPFSSYGYILAITASDTVHFYMASGGVSWGDSGSVNIAADTLTNDTTAWHYIAVVIDRSANANCHIFIDGKDHTGTINGDIRLVGTVANSYSLRIGIEADNGYPFFGNIDEVVIGSQIRSADWVKLCYVNQQQSDALVQFK